MGQDATDNLLMDIEELLNEFTWDLIGDDEYFETPRMIYEGEEYGDVGMGFEVS